MKTNQKMLLEKKYSMKTPLPGRAVKGSQSGKPIMAALNLLSRRWVLRIIWELRQDALGFREIRTRCDLMSPDTLSTRLNELKEAGVVTHDKMGAWTLTELGYGLAPALISLSDWSKDWADYLAREELEKS